MKLIKQKVIRSYHEYFVKFLNNELDMWKFYQIIIRICAFENINIDISQRLKLVNKALQGDKNAENLVYSYMNQDRQIIGNFLKKYEYIKVETMVERKYYKEGFIAIERSFLR